MTEVPSPSDTADSPPVRRRLVAYLSGFDPQGPAHYQQLYATEAPKQAAVSGYRLDVGKRRKYSEHVAGWELDAELDGINTRTRYEFLRWDDIVRAHWPRSRWGLLRGTAFASWAMWRNGVMWHSWRRSWPMFVAIALPGFSMLLVALLGLALLATSGGLVMGGQGLGGSLLLLLGGPLLVLGARWAEHRTHMAWLMRSLACLVRQGRGQTPELEARLTLHAEHLARQWRSGEFDEVLVVGHSSGAMMAASIMARTLKALADEPARMPQRRLALLTLGHCSPLLSAQAEAQAFRDELRLLGKHPALCWVDYGAPPDGCCFPLINPCEGLGLPEGAGPKLLNPRFAQLFGPTTYQALRKDKFRCHFQYLMASEQPGAYDYFAMTAGPWSLAARHAQVKGNPRFRDFQCFGGPFR